jgi:hypothetical protein
MTMPERTKLTPQQVEAVLKSGPRGKWVVVNIADGVILGSGSGTLSAIRDAKARHPKMDIDDVAVMLISALPHRKSAGV